MRFFIGFPGADRSRYRTRVAQQSRDKVDEGMVVLLEILRGEKVGLPTKRSSKEK
jgi:hypothetical protein